MKKTLFAIAILAIALAGCKTKPSNTETLKELETKKMDSLALKMDSAKKAIDTTAKRVDKLVKGQ